MPTIRQFARIIALTCPEELHEVIERAKNVDELEVVVRTASALGKKRRDEVDKSNREMLEKYRAKLQEATEELVAAGAEIVGLKLKIEDMDKRLVQASVRAGDGTCVSSEQPLTFKLMLTNAGVNKIGVIKAVREITNLGLKEAKDLVDNSAHTNQQVIVGTLDKIERAERTLREAGAGFSRYYA